MLDRMGLYVANVVLKYDKERLGDEIGTNAYFVDSSEDEDEDDDADEDDSDPSYY